MCANYKYICFYIALIFLFPILGRANNVGFDSFLLGLPYNVIKDQLHSQGYSFQEYRIGKIRYITCENKQVKCFLIFNYFDRLYTVLVTIRVDDNGLMLLKEHLEKRYGKISRIDERYIIELPMYHIVLYRDKHTGTATVEYTHTYPLFAKRSNIQQTNPFAQF